MVGSMKRGRRLDLVSGATALVVLACVSVGLLPSAAAASNPLDASFGNRGIQTLPLSGGGKVNATAVTADGSIMAVGQAGGRNLIAKLTDDGWLDTAFGSNGFAPWQSFAFSECSGERCEGAFNSVWTDASGWTIVAGWQGTGSGIAKLSGGGSWDPEYSNFGNFGFYSGYRDVRFNDTARVPGGGFTSVGYGGDRTRKSTGATAFHFDPNGSTAFRWGNVRWGFEVDNNLYELQLPKAGERGANGRMTGLTGSATGLTYTTGWVRTGKRAPKRMFVNAIDKGGAPVSGYGATSPGLSLFGPGTKGAAIVNGRNKNAFVAGTKVSRGTSRIVVAKLTQRGRLDKGFGKQGIVTVPVRNAVARTVSLVGGRLYVGGFARTADGTKRAVIASYTSGGAPRTSFGNRGRMVSKRLTTANSFEFFFDGTARGRRLMIVGGSARAGKGEVPAVARFVG